ncbi:hypothetical protein ABZ805_14960 [Saccharopolyspora sp. NPDC047091]|uniref:hypothetical protein n=1 Tax=Saccharopolyspora sp. NPDC047091 TaxID=3155924 RepID=UPI0033F2D5BF
MSVVERLGASLAARAGWCAPDEPVWWATRVTSTEFEVGGLDASGAPKSGVGKRLAGAAGKVGIGVLGFALTAMTEGNERYEKNRSGPPEKDLRVFGSSPQCDAVRSLQSPPPAPPTESLWVLTSRRLGVLVPLPEETAADDPAPTGWRGVARGLGEVGRSVLASSGFGANEAGAPMNADTLGSWFELGPGDIAECRSAGVKNRPTHCEIVLRDGSGFAVRGMYSRDVDAMTDAVQAFARGRQWSGRA